MVRAPNNPQNSAPTRAPTAAHASIAARHLPGCFWAIVSLYCAKIEFATVDPKHPPALGVELLFTFTPQLRYPWTYLGLPVSTTWVIHSWANPATVKAPLSEPPVQLRTAVNTHHLPLASLCRSNWVLMS